VEEAPRLVRSESECMIAGVCGGLAAHFSIDPTLVRIVFIILALFGGSGFVLYLALWLIVPRASQVHRPPRENVRGTVDEGRQLLQNGVEATRRVFGKNKPPDQRD
jgi:phage shock protein C